MDKGSMRVLIAWIILYGIIYRLSESISGIIGIDHCVTVLSMLLYWRAMFVYLNKNNCASSYYICAPKSKKISGFYVYVPLILMAAVNAVISYRQHTMDSDIVYQPAGIISGINLLTTCLLTVSCVIGEEVFFRGIFLTLLMKHRLRAIIVTSLSFSFMHILNILSGESFYYVTIQALNAAAVGFCLAVVSCIEHSIIPGIVIHSLINISSLYIDDWRVFGTLAESNVVFVVLPIVYIVYGIYLYQKGQERKML